MQSNNVENNESQVSQIKGHIDSGFEYYSNILNGKIDEVNSKIGELENRAVENVNSHITESSHENFKNLCNEIFKMNNALKKGLKRYQYINCALSIIIVILLFVLVVR